MVEKLSGGEKKRLNLMKVLMQNPNFLILDEPTNDLDIDTLNVLEEFLENFPGILMLVSHDRYLLDKMSDQLFIMEGEGVVKIYNGNYSEYRLSLEQPKAKVETKKAPASVIEQAPVKAAKKLSFKEQKELEESEKGMEEMESKISKLSQTLNSIDATDYIKIQEVSAELENLQAKLDDYTMRWLELSE
ncbi:putative ABC transporter ATP-binding protein [compost metagenome]